MGNNQPACPEIWDHEHWFDTYTIYRKETKNDGRGTMRSAGIVCKRDGVFIKTDEGYQKYNKGRLVTFPEAAGEHLTISKRKERDKMYTNPYWITPTVKFSGNGALGHTAPVRRGPDGMK